MKQSGGFPSPVIYTFVDKLIVCCYISHQLYGCCKPVIILFDVFTVVLCIKSQNLAFAKLSARQTSDIRRSRRRRAGARHNGNVFENHCEL